MDKRAHTDIQTLIAKVKGKLGNASDLHSIDWAMSRLPQLVQDDHTTPGYKAGFNADDTASWNSAIAKIQSDITAKNAQQALADCAALDAIMAKYPSISGKKAA